MTNELLNALPEVQDKLAALLLDADAAVVVTLHRTKQGPIAGLFTTNNITAEEVSVVADQLWNAANPEVMVAFEQARHEKRRQRGPAHGVRYVDASSPATWPDARN